MIKISKEIIAEYITQSVKSHRKYIKGWKSWMEPILISDITDAISFVIKETLNTESREEISGSINKELDELIK